MKFLVGSASLSTPLDPHLDKEKAAVGFPIISPCKSHVPPAGELSVAGGGQLV